MRAASSVWTICFVLIFSVTAFSASQGLIYPLLALVMERSGASSSEIAFNSAMTPLGIIVSAPLINRYALRFPRGGAIAASIAGTVILVLLIGVVADPDIWLVLRFLLGGTVNAVFVLSETSLLAVAPASHRGRLMGAYTSITNVGYAIGPLILAIVGTKGMTPFAANAAFLTLAVIPFVVIKVVVDTSWTETERKTSIPRFLRNGGLLVAAYMSTTLVDNGFMTLFPSYALGFGVSEQSVSLILFSLFLGGALFQMPVGWAVDRGLVSSSLFGCVLIGVLGFIVIGPLLMYPFLAVAFAFLWGGGLLGVQTVALVELGRRYTGSMLLAGNASLALTWGVAGVAGVPLTGVAMDGFGPNGLLIVIGGVFSLTALAFTIEVLVRGRGRQFGAAFGKD